MLLGLDLGTTNIKALLVAPDGGITAEGSHPVPLRKVDGGGVEQDIEEIWQATLGAIRNAGQHADLAKVEGVGISSQGGALQIREADGRPVGPAISWMDARGQPFDERFTRQQGEQWFARRTGHGASAIAAGQLFRLRETDPAMLASPRCIGFVGDAVVERFCGRIAHHASSLSICDLYNPWLRRADPEVLALLGINENQLPELMPATEPAGVLNAASANATGLKAGIPVSSAAHDQYASALGCGAIAPGDVTIGTGTAWVILAVSDRLLPPVVPGAWVSDHVIPQRWGQLLSMACGGESFRWAMQLTGMGEATGEEIDRALEAAPPGSDGLQIWPFLDGVGGYRRLLSGRMTGLRLYHGRNHLLRATTEGLCYELTRQLGWLERAGCPVRRVILCGGAARSRCTPQIVADVTARPVSCPAVTETSAFGAAILARAMLEPDTPIEVVYRAMQSPTRELPPGTASEAYRPHLQEYLNALDRET